MSLSRALQAFCLYETRGGKVAFGQVTEADANQRKYAIILTPWTMKPGEYAVLHSNWDDISDSGLVKAVLKELPRSEVVLRAGRQALTFKNGDDVFLRIKFSAD
jgi:hypothetical protein